MLGYGALGRETARLLKSHGMRIIAANTSGKANNQDGVSSHRVSHLLTAHGREVNGVTISGWRTERITTDILDSISSLGPAIKKAQSQSHTTRQKMNRHSRNSSSRPTSLLPVFQTPRIQLTSWTPRSSVRLIPTQIANRNPHDCWRFNAAAIR